eukprot:scaffold36972_cov27-Prasinocladus_malaysianus.AAC.4
MRAFGSMGTMLEGLLRASRTSQAEGFSDYLYAPAAPPPNRGMVKHPEHPHVHTGRSPPDLFTLEILLLVLLWTFALYTAFRCGGVYPQDQLLNSTRVDPSVPGVSHRLGERTVSEAPVYEPAADRATKYTYRRQELALPFCHPSFRNTTLSHRLNLFGISTDSSLKMIEADFEFALRLYRYFKEVSRPVLPLIDDHSTRRKLRAGLRAFRRDFWNFNPQTISYQLMMQLMVRDVPIPEVLTIPAGEQDDFLTDVHLLYSAIMNR